MNQCNNIKAMSYIVLTIIKQSRTIILVAIEHFLKM